MPFPFFSRRPAPPTVTAPPPPAYDPDLIPALQSEHTVLLALLQQVRQAAKDGRYLDVNAGLQRFEIAYKAHQQRKERQLLPYMEQHIQLEQGKTLLRNLAGSSTLTERSVQGFLRHYAASPISDLNLKRFGRELDGVIAELSHRLDTETTSLHGLYQPVHLY
jgi:23S rRNA A2030 N6-methylase RlmJ